jgi:4-hydroxy-tetrahydrodipicolinate synthase
MNLMKPIIGSIVALITPMHEDGTIDFDTLRQLIDWHIVEGTDCISVVGTTGESPTVNVHEHCEIIRVAVEQARGRVPIMAGAGANSTAEAIELSKFAKQVGAACTLQVVPYYNKPTQEGIYAHFKAIAESVEIPMVLYNVPGRTGADMQPSTALKLSRIPGIVGIKEANGDFDRFAGLIREAPKHFSIYSGDDLTAPGLMLMGGHGTISVTANVAPRAMHELCKAAIGADALHTRAAHARLLPLHRQLLAESNPIPVKWALSRMKRCRPTLRLPLTPLSEHLHAPLEATLRELELI